MLGFGFHFYISLYLMSKQTRDRVKPSRVWKQCQTLCDAHSIAVVLGSSAPTDCITQMEGEWKVPSPTRRFSFVQWTMIYNIIPDPISLSQLITSSTAQRSQSLTGDLQFYLSILPPNRTQQWLYNSCLKLNSYLLVKYAKLLPYKCQGLYLDC